MSQSHPTPDKYAMRAQWKARGPHWDGQADRLAEMADRMNRPFIEKAGITPGQNVLDLASGAGEPALTIARLVGGGGSVMATDLVEEMLEGCRRRAAAAGIGNMSFQIADMEMLPFSDGRFDRVTSRFGIMFVPRADIALKEMLRVLKPGGRTAVLVWGPIAATTMFTALADAGRRVFGDDPSFDFETPFRFGDDGVLAELFRTAGFHSVAEHDVRFTPEAPADRAFWAPQLQLSMGPRLRTATESEKSDLDKAIRRAFAPNLDGAVYRLQAQVKIVTGDKNAD
ncbi:MAG: class I SAM-dependent methyltransferase [Alphaproteobacteria bacterium]|nr:class I SAM-dependent methyltransferase [Alphaproteobacteria bacterium]